MADCCCRMKERDANEQKKLLNRLNRIEGQIRGIKKMVEEDAYCIDIINQAMAAGSALNSFNKELLAEHISTCVADDIKSGSDIKLEELLETVKKIMK